MKKLFCLLVALTMLLCSTALMEAVPAPTLFTPGTYQAEAQGFGGKVQVVITVTENEIVDVAITGANETPALGGVAVETLGAAIVKAQTPNVDAVAGATVTSSAIVAAATEALLQAGADIAVLDEFRRDTAEDIAREEKTLDTQVVIIGAGGAGMTAAVMLHQAGVDFVILEKMPYVGGNTTKATGGMNAAETHYQKEQGIEDSVELFISDTMTGGHNLNDPNWCAPWRNSPRAPSNGWTASALTCPRSPSPAAPPPTASTRPPTAAPWATTWWTNSPPC